MIKSCNDRPDPGQPVPWLVTCLILLSSCAPASAQTGTAPVPAPQDEDGGTIQVTGQADVSVEADQVRISFTVETESSSAGEATRQNAERMAGVLTALRGMDIQGMTFETFGYILRPEYEVSREGTGTRSISGYRVQNNLLVTLPDVESTGQVLDRAVESGANRIANLQFEASDTRSARLQALQGAVVQAREQAEAIASAMGVHLGPALEVQGGANVPSPLRPGAVMMRAAAETTTPVEPGEQKVTASVTITYRILESGS